MDRTDFALIDESTSTGEIQVQGAPTSPRVMVLFTAIGIMFALFYAVWFLRAYDEPNVPMVVASFATAFMLIAGLPMARTPFATTASVIALSFSALAILLLTATVTTAASANLCFLGLGFILLALVPEHRHHMRTTYSAVVIPLAIACEFLFPAAEDPSDDDLARAEFLSTVNRIWTIVVVVIAMAIIRYRSSHRQRDLSGAAELGEYRANTDAMTGISNRRPVLARLRELDADSSHGYAVALIDIDSFKSINDKLGHEEGDALISAIARRLRAHFRQTDLVSRWGGDEFLVLLPSVDPDELHAVLERLRASVAGSPFSLGAEPITVTLSIGVAIACPTMSSHETVRAADEALYNAKHTGRNRVVMADRAGADLSERANLP
jgi:diguanylate cyclase (GGDEF)-like protein